MNILEEKRFGIDFNVDCILMEWSVKGAYIPSSIVKKNITDLCSIQLFENMDDVNHYVRNDELSSSPLIYHLKRDVADLDSSKKTVVATFETNHNTPFHILVPIDVLNEDSFKFDFVDTLANANQILVVKNDLKDTSETSKELVVIAS
ncbi:hypothetical protein ABC382_00560 [Lysinibacillus sp. 1P01SD]|uniref:hypothetical protein n=1 Tax=Lysinibacillus sp. 1P01SD TaxID=3132285 RepID=UPI0039A28BFF